MGLAHGTCSILLRAQGFLTNPQLPSHPLGPYEWGLQRRCFCRCRCLVGCAGVWFQDDLLYHNSLFHASHHLSPVAASSKQVALPLWPACWAQVPGSVLHLTCSAGLHGSGNGAHVLGPFRGGPVLTPFTSLPGSRALHGGLCAGWQMEEEIRAVKGVSRRLCPPLVSLDRVLLTSTGVLLACWQVGMGMPCTLTRNGPVRGLDANPRGPRQMVKPRRPRQIVKQHGPVGCLPRAQECCPHPMLCGCSYPALSVARSVGGSAGSTQRSAPMPSLALLVWSCVGRSWKAQILLNSEPCCAMPSPGLPRSKR